MKEVNVKNREGIISAISSYLRGINTDGKREFLADYSGLTFLKAALHSSVTQIRLSKKLVMLLQDLVINDHLIMFGGNPCAVRNAISNDKTFMDILMQQINSGPVDDYQMNDLRDSILSIFEHLAIYKPEILAD